MMNSLMSDAEFRQCLIYRTEVLYAALLAMGKDLERCPKSGSEQYACYADVACSGCAEFYIEEAERIKNEGCAPKPYGVDN